MSIIINVLIIFLLILLILAVFIFIFKQMSNNKYSCLGLNNNIPYQNNNQEILTTSMEILCNSIRDLYSHRRGKEDKLCCTNFQIVELISSSTINAQMIKNEMLNKYKIQIKDIKFEYYNCFYPTKQTLCILIKFN